MPLVGMLFNHLAWQVVDLVSPAPPGYHLICEVDKVEIDTSFVDT